MKVIPERVVHTKFDIYIYIKVKKERKTVKIQSN
jgi:hypothetical protein